MEKKSKKIWKHILDFDVLNKITKLKSNIWILFIIKQILLIQIIIVLLSFLKKWSFMNQIKNKLMIIMILLILMIWKYK
jgi:hypothetical protein